MVARKEPRLLPRSGHIDDGVYENYRSSPSSRIPSLETPFTNPLISLKDLTGMRWTTPSFSITASFWPGFSLIRSRISLGITTWYFGETVTVAMLDFQPYY